MTRRRRSTVGLLTAFGFAVLAQIGFTDGSIGPSWPAMRAEFGLSVSGLGTLTAVLTMGFIAGSLIAPRITSRAGIGRSMVGAVGLSEVALFGFVLAPNWLLINIAWFVIGLAGGWLDASMNGYFARYRSPRAMNLLHGMFGVGATLGPLVVVMVLPAWRWAFVGLAAVGLVLFAITLAVSPLWKAAPAEIASTARPPRRSTLAAFFFYTGMEVATGQWSFTLLFEQRGMSQSSAGRWVGLFWAGLTIGRLGMGFFGKRISVRTAIDSSVLTIAVGALILWLDPAGWGAVGLPVLGFGMAAVFPGLVSLTPAQVGGSGTEAAVGYQLAVAGLGAAILPWVVGILAEQFTIEVLGPVLGASWLVLAYAWFRARVVRVA
ncbi:MAG: MFS transporter [Acidimicrobiia bacterium]|nr:MFS transporter [Acidimicrobiia bacterium]